jgi:hypothetical protein
MDENRFGAELAEEMSESILNRMISGRACVAGA